MGDDSAGTTGGTMSLTDHGHTMVAPPLPLIAFVGAPQVHKQLGQQLKTQCTPRMNSVGIADASQATKLFPVRKGASGAGANGDLAPEASGRSAADAAQGIIRTRWFSKHRKCRPACAALFLDYGDFV